MRGRDHGRPTRGKDLSGDLGELTWSKPEQHLGQQLGEAWLHRHPAREPAALHCELAGEDGGHFLISAILKQPGEQQVSGLKQSQVFLVVDLA